MEFLNPSTDFNYTYLNESIIYVNKTKKSLHDDFIYLNIGFPLTMLLLGAGIIVNILLIIATRNSPRLKAPIFQLLFAIAFADILLLIAFAVPEIANKVQDQEWILGSKACTFLVFLQFLPTHVTSCLIVLCCGERFYAVCRPHSAHWITSRRMSGIIAIVWLLNAGVLAPLLVMTKEVMLKYPPSDDNSEMSTALSCHLEMPADVKKLYFTVMGMIFYGITAIVSFAFLACTICKAMNIDLDNYFIKDDFKNHILKCTAAITVVSIVFWLPYRYVYFYNLHSPTSTARSDNDVVVVLGTAMVIFGGAVKPVIYITASSQFRKSVFRALKCCKSDDNEFEEAHGYQMSERGETSSAGGPLLT